MFRRLAVFVFVLLFAATLPPHEAFSKKGGGGNITPVSISQRRDMQFGNFASSVTGSGTVVLSPHADTATASAALTSFGGTIRRAQFRITGQANWPVFVYLPSSITIRDRRSGRTMVVDTFTMNVQNPVVLDNRGRATIYIGATLRVGTGQTAGDYNRNNDFTVSAGYN